MPAVRASRTTSFYVYYRIVGDSKDTRDRIRALFADVKARTGVRGTLSARTDDPTTWMETYASVRRAASFRRMLAELAVKHDVLALTPDAKRHVEEFSPLPPLPARTKP
jgi:hypothetical protein